MATPRIMTAIEARRLTVSSSEEFKAKLKSIGDLIEKEAKRENSSAILKEGQLLDPFYKKDLRLRGYSVTEPLDKKNKDLIINW